MSKYDVVYMPNQGVQLEEHFCREYGCFGSDETHGMTFEEAKKEIISYLKEQIKAWEEMTEENLYSEEPVYVFD